MCELLALSFNHPVRPVFSFPSLLKGCWRHWDGWGLGYYPEGSKSAQVFKEPYTGIRSELAAFLQNHQGLRSDIFIAHIRKSSRGHNIFDNTHPFSRYYSAREWLFAHNGTLPKRKNLLNRIYFPIGDTDSELAFCTLLNRMKAKRIKPATRRRYNGYTDLDFDFIYEALRDINGTDKGSFNVIFSDGQYLFCYRDRAGARELNYLRREYPFHSTTLRDQDIEVDLQVVKEREDRGYVISTQPLSDENWISFRDGEMIVFRGGEIVTRRQ